MMFFSKYSNWITLNHLPIYHFLVDTNSLIKRIPVDSAMMQLNMGNKETFKRWCKENDVTIVPDVGGRFVIEAEFLAKANKKAISEMQTKYGVDWNSKLLNQNYQSLQKANTVLALRAKKYSPKSDEASEFSKKWKNI